MKFDIKEIEKMSKNELVNLYLKSGKSDKKKMLETMKGNIQFPVLMGGLTNQDLIEMAKIHPYKEVFVDAMIDEMENHRNLNKVSERELIYQKNFFNQVMSAVQYKGAWQKFKDLFSRNKSLPDALPQKIEQARKLKEQEQKRLSATGKKMEDIENIKLDELSDESRVEINSGEMAKIFDRSYKTAMENGKGEYESRDKKALLVREQLENEYTEILGEDIGKLVAGQELESFDGDQDIYVPYGERFTAGAYKQRSGAVDSRNWKKNMLEIEQVQDFSAGGKNFGEIFVVKSEFNPTTYAVKGKWSPVYEYFTKTEDGNFKRIGHARMSEKTGKMETILMTDGNEIQCDAFNDLEKLKENGQAISFDTTDYTGNSSKITRKDIEQKVTMKSLQDYFKGKEIADITQVKDLPIISEDEKGNRQVQNAYMIACVENGEESYHMVYIDESGECKAYPDMHEDFFERQQNINFPTGMTTGKDKATSLNIMDTKQALDTFRTRNGTQYSAYRDQNGILRVAQMMEYTNGSGKYAEELDTYTVMHGDIEELKRTTSRSENLLTIQKEKEKKKHLSEKKKTDEDRLSI